MRGCGKGTTNSDKPRTLAEQWLNQYGIGINSSTENSRITRKRQVDYLKLNDGLDVTSNEPSSPKPKKRKKNHLPSHSGPTTSRQRAQKAKISSPVQEPKCAPKTTTEITAVTSTTTPPTDESSGVHPSTNIIPDSIDTVSGVQSTLAGVQSPPDGSHELSTEDKLPDLVIPEKNNKEECSAVLNIVPPVGEKPPDHIFDGATTEEEFDAVDALLSLSTPRDITADNVLDDNSTLMPVGGSAVYEDVNPVPVHLDQVTVDGAIAEIVEQEDILENTQLLTLNNSEISGAQSDDPKAQDKNIKENKGIIDVSGVQPSLSGRQTTLQMHGKGADNFKTASDGDSELKKQKGIIKVTMYGIKKKSNIDGRSYRCSICGVKKRSVGNLNAHHRRRHEAQMCGICGKVFELASTLMHHMYTHDERRFFCEKSSYHCHFESELKKHNITHHSQPSHQCMHKNCGRWFKQKADLVLHVKTHRKDLISCEKCDYKTTLQKYLKEHMKSHENKLPYSCTICNKRFLWRSGLRAHKQKEHSGGSK